MNVVTKICVSVFVFVIGGCVAPDRGGLGSFRTLYTTPHGHSVVNDPTGQAPSPKVERFEVRQGDCGVTPGGWNDCKNDRERFELAQQDRSPAFGVTQWYGWSIYFPEDHPNISPARSIYGQFKVERQKHPAWFFEHSPLGLVLESFVINGPKRKFPLISEEDLRGKWHRIEVQARWSPGPAGIFRVWVNGEQKVDHSGPSTRGITYLQYGIYRSHVSRYLNPPFSPRPATNTVPTQIVYYANVRSTIQRPSTVRRLGDIPTALSTPTSVGGIPGKGAVNAVRLISGAIKDGAGYFIRSDIKDFFTKVPTARLIQSIREQTGDDEFTNLVEAGLAVELENAADPVVAEWRWLFPDGETGVPQGSSLSAFCANYVLRELDAELNAPGLTMVRYIDDFVILGRSQAEVQDGWNTAVNILGSLGLEAHPPAPGGSKASLGPIRDGFDFLSYRFRNAQIGLSRDVKKRLIDEIDADIAAAKRSIQASLTIARRAEPRFAQALVGLDRKVRGWGDSFRDVNQRVEFAQLDDKIMDRVGKFIGWYSSRVGGLDQIEKMRGLGIAVLADTPARGIVDGDDPIR